MTWGYWDFPEGGRVRGARLWRRELAYRLALDGQTHGGTDSKANNYLLTSA